METDGIIAQAGAKRLQVSAVITRADGTVEDLGLIVDERPGEDQKSLFDRLRAVFGKE